MTLAGFRRQQDETQSLKLGDPARGTLVSRNTDVSVPYLRVTTSSGKYGGRLSADKPMAPGSGGTTTEDLG